MSNQLTEEWHQEAKTSGKERGWKVCHQLLGPLLLSVFYVPSSGVTDPQLAHAGP